MTRINANINPKRLTDEHLLAEHREIKRLPHCASKSVSMQDIPNEFTLGKGHVRFFYDKMDFTFDRYTRLYNECLERNFDVTYFGDNWNGMKGNGQWTATEKDNRIVTERIEKRINESSKRYFHYFGKRITKSEAIKILKSEI